MNKKGFTLIELLIVVVIIGILAAIAIPRFSQTRERAFLSTMQSDLRNLQTVQEQYYADPETTPIYTYGDQAAVIGANLFGPSNAVTVTITSASGTGWGANATHTGLTGTTCYVFVGDPATHRGSAPATAVSGEIACTGTGTGS